MIAAAQYDACVSRLPPAASASPHQSVESLAETVDAGNGSSEEARAVSVTQRLGRFLVLRQLGAGSMGSVFAAYDEQLDRKVAVKLLHAAPNEHATRQMRVLREAQAMARVSHPNVVHVYDVGEIQDQIFIAMEYIDGSTLADWQRQKSRTWQEVLGIYRQAGHGLHAAHQAGLVHRDFKPENVLIAPDGQPRVADFGLARLGGETAPFSEAPAPESSQPAIKISLTATGTLSGTPLYMSPEQFSCGPADSRSDQFSFCVALYEALFQQRPFSGDTVAEVAAEVLAGRLRPMPEGSPVPIEIRRALMRGLAVSAHDRFASMLELLQALDVDTERDPAGARRARWRLSAMLLALSVVLMAIFPSRLLPRAPTVLGYTLVMLFVVLIWALGMSWFRRTLLANTFHRGLSQQVLIGVLTLLGVRVIALQQKLDLLTLYPLDLMVFAGVIGSVAWQFLSSLRWMVAVLLAACLGTLGLPNYASEIAALTYTLVPLAFIYSWFNEKPAARRFPSPS